MAKRKAKNAPVVEIKPGIMRDQAIVDTIETNYMPYVMTVIISRAIPQIDGFKPAHRKLLFMMYRKGLLGGDRTKSANVVGETMKLNPHGDASIYDTMVRLTVDNEALLHPFVDSKGAFGKHYSAETPPAAPRYTEVRLMPVCKEIFGGIEKNAVDMVPNYDGTIEEPTLLPTSFPNVLITPNKGIAVGMASNICSFNLCEICDGAIALLKNDLLDVDQLLDLVLAPDFSGGGELLYDREALSEIYRTGQGSVRVRARYVYNKEDNCIEVTQIPYTTTIEAIMKKLIDMIREGKLKEVTDLRDETDLSGMKLAMDLRRGVDPDKLMARLYKCTPLEDSFVANFNVLIDDTPRTMGVLEILHEWIRFRLSCVKRELSYDLQQKKDKLHLLVGLGKILLDIDKAIRIIRETRLEKDVVPNLMEGFDVDKIQAEFIAEIKLRHLNREFILNKVKEISELQKQIEELEALIGSEKALKKYIVKQLEVIKEKYGIPRKTIIVRPHEIKEYVEEKKVDASLVRLVFTRQGYFKKITMQSLRGNDEISCKEGDEVLINVDGSNDEELLFFSDQGRCYKSRVDDFDATKASALGDYVAAKLSFEKDERCVYMINLKRYDPKESVLFVFENGKGVKVALDAYETKGARKKLTGAYSTASPIVGILREVKPFDFVLTSSDGKAIQISSALVPLKATRSAGGVTLFSLKKGAKVDSVRTDVDVFSAYRSYKKIKVPATGLPLPEELKA